MAFGDEKPKKDPFKAIWKAIAGLQTQIDDLESSSIDLTDIENRLTALEENPVVKNTPPTITIENIVVSGYREVLSKDSPLTQCDVEYDLTIIDDGLMMPMMPTDGHKTFVIENIGFGSFNQEIGGSAYDGIYRVVTSTTVACQP